MKRLIVASAMLVTLSAALFLNGCATQAQRQFAAIKTENQENNAQIKACVAAVYNLPENAPLRQHIPLNITDVTLQQLSDTSLASQDEIHAILVAHPQLQQCRKAFLTNLAQTEPSVVPILTTTYNKNEDDLVALIQRKISWGEYIHRIRDRGTETQVAVKGEERRIVGELRQENQFELEQRQRAAEALTSWAQTQELINAANRPVVTNCNAFSNTLNCISH
jgi:hypothetical protein